MFLAEAAAAVCEEGYVLKGGECVEEANAVLKIMQDGGFMMWIILAVSVLGLMIFFERAYSLYFARALSTRKFLKATLDAVKARRYSQALAACNVKGKHPLVPVVKAGILRANRREKEIERAMEAELMRSLGDVTGRIGIIALFANMATLLGLLGTILGLMEAFSAVAAASATERQEALASGISTAMYTTAFGILVAVMLLFVHHFVSKRSEDIVLETEAGAAQTLVALTGPVDEQPAGSGQGSARAAA